MSEKFKNSNKWKSINKNNNNKSNEKRNDKKAQIATFIY